VSLFCDQQGELAGNWRLLLRRGLTRGIRARLAQCILKTNLGSMCEGEIVGNNPTLSGESVKAWFIRLRVQPLLG
jgi:hypothetical protein